MKIEYDGNIIYEKKVNSLMELEEEILETSNSSILNKNYDPISYGIALAIFLVQEAISYIRAKADKERIDELESLVKDLISEKSTLKKTRRSDTDETDIVDAFLSLKAKGILKVEFDTENENEVKLAFEDLEKKT